MGDPPDDEWEMDRAHIYWNAHVDKANIPTYDYSVHAQTLQPIFPPMTTRYTHPPTHARTLARGRAGARGQIRDRGRGFGGWGSRIRV